ncbi:MULTISPECIES: butyrate kinase [Olsenella]|uniref:butyrate kinase n=1 Tax=Olsenella TaxID=133925 RepID=UPI0007824644|nr:MULTISPECIES: butyrate kinase [Olsenella]KXB63418.1 butyrate kinase [Olsenella sp. DNF00959]
MAERDYRILVINPGSTSTKVGVFDGETEVLTKTVAHEASKLAEFAGISEQLPYRLETIEAALAEGGVDLATVDAFVGRGGGLLPLPGGTYRIDDVLLDHATRGANGVQHPAQLGPQIARRLADASGKPAFAVNPPDTDELCDEARMTGIRGVYRHVHLHALNLKETAIRHARSMGRRYEDCNFVVCHIGGGISVSAHRGGRMIDGFDIVGGEGMMAPTRCGGVPVAEVLNYLEAGHDVREARALCMKTGGFVDLLGTSDAIEVTRRVAAGDEAARRAWEALLYQLDKSIASMAGALGGKVDGILLGGGMVHNADLVRSVEEGCGWIAPVSAYPGEFELEAMAAGAIRVLDGEEEAKTYTGIPTFQGFACFE